MIQQLTLIGGDHYNDSRSYWWVYEQIEKARPDCITLEQTLSPGGFVPVPFMMGADKFEQEGKNDPQLVMDPFSAGIVYALRNNDSLFVIDGYVPNSGYWDTNLTADGGWKRFRERTKKDKSYDRLNDWLYMVREKVLHESRYNNWTRRNIIMAEKIQRLHERGFTRFVHIGGRGHYDGQRCVPLQNLVVTQTVQIIDAVEKTGTTLG